MVSNFQPWQSPGPPTPIEPGGYLCSFPDTWTPLSREKDIPAPPPPPSQVLVTIGNYKKHPLFRAFSANLPQTTAKNTPLSRENGSTHAFEWGAFEGGGWGTEWESILDQHMQNSQGTQMKEQCQILDTCRVVLTQDKGECRPNPTYYKYSNSIIIFTDITNIGIGLIFVLCCFDIWNMINGSHFEIQNGGLIPVIILYKNSINIISGITNISMHTICDVLCGSQVEIYEQNIIINGGHFEIQDGGLTPLITLYQYNLWYITNIGTHTILCYVLCGSQVEIYEKNMIINGGHFEIQNGGISTWIIITEIVSLKSLVSQTYVLAPFLIFYGAHKLRYMNKCIN